MGKEAQTVQEHVQNSTGSKQSPITEHPLAILAGAGTVGVLCYGIYNMQRGGSSLAANKAMGLRIYAQFATVVLLGGAAIYQTYFNKS